MSVLFSADHLAVGYGGKPLIRDIAVELERGRILVLIGPNGSGKSTILKTITKHLAPMGGAVYLEGTSVEAMSRSIFSRSLSVVLTQRLKAERMTCGEVVETGRYPYTGRLGRLTAHDRAQAEEAMALVHAAELRNENFHQISDGQRQRVLLARAICQQPKVIVLDEPTTFLDIHYKLELMELLRMLARDKGLGVIVSLHELDMAQRIADQVLCVKGDTITHYGSPEEIFREPLMRELYDLQGGSFNPLFGSLELSKPAGIPRLFVVAGGGSGIPVYRKLQKERTPFVTGILQENDVDYQTARMLASEVISVPAFQPISDAAFRSACACLSGCTAVMNCQPPWGELNEKNRALLSHAKKLGLPTRA